CGGDTEGNSRTEHDKGRQSSKQSVGIDAKEKIAMGTSRGYKMPTGGSWTPLKNEATDFVQGAGSTEIAPSSLVANFIRATGGLAGLLRGHGGAAPLSGVTKGAGSKAKGRGGGGAAGGAGTGTSAAVGTARNLGGFLSSVADVGLEK